MSSVQVIQTLVADPFAQGAIHRYFHGREGVIIQQYTFETTLTPLPNNVEVIKEKLFRDSFRMFPDYQYLVEGLLLVLYPWVSKGDGELRYAGCLRKVNLIEETPNPQWDPTLFAISRKSYQLEGMNIFSLPIGHYEGPPNKVGFSTALEYELIALDLLGNLLE